MHYRSASHEYYVEIPASASMEICQTTCTAHPKYTDSREMYWAAKPAHPCSHTFFLANLNFRKNEPRPKLDGS